jgi:hypothetical protein
VINNGLEDGTGTICGRDDGIVNVHVVENASEEAELKVMILANKFKWASFIIKGNLHAIRKVDS